MSTAIVADAGAASSVDDLVRSRDDGGKRRQILDGARRVFLGDGFDGASMNDIARVAGVSKGTLYVYFTNKESLFEALIREEKREQAEQFCNFDPDDHDVRSCLVRFGTRLLDQMLRPSAIAHLRTVMAVGAKFPNIGRAFYEAGPACGAARLAAYLDAQVAAGMLDTDDTEAAAFHFLEMCKGPHLLRAVFGVSERPSDAALDRHVGRSTDAFLRAYAKR